MMDMHPLVLGYVDDVCRQVKARELRKEIKQELASHLDELMELKREQGHDDNAAARWAIAQMGDTASVAQGLNQVHKPRIPWAMLGCLVLLITIALVTMYAVQLSYAADQRKVMTGIDLFLRQAVYMVAGLVVLFALSRFHYRRLLNFSWTLYGGTVALLLSVFMWGPRTNGISYLRLGPITMDVVGVSPYLLIVAAAGLLYRQKENTWKLLLHAVLFSVIPMLLYAIVPSVSELAIYAFAYALLLYASGCGWRWLIPHAFVFALILAMITLFSRFGRERFAAFFHRHEVPMDAGYMYIQIDEAVRSAGWWGHGFASVTQRLPYIHSDIIFTYIVYSLGWLTGAFVLVTALLFITQLVKAVLSVQDLYGKMLICGLGALFAVQFGWGFGMSLGVLPIASVSLPFISYGGSGLLIQLAAVGMIYSVYRRKDMIRIR